MTHFIKTWLLLTLLAATTSTCGVAASPAKASYYLIGNSLTWDTVPSLLSGDVQWHVDCGTHLRHVYNNPGKPCVTNSTLWPTALRDKQYDVISVQPHYGSTLAQDVETIGAWMKLQPKAVFVIHSGWAKQVLRADEFASYNVPDAMVHSPAYFRALLAELRRQHPGRELRQTFAQNLLAQIAEDIAAGKAPIKQLVDLYRDDIHLKPDSGKYLMHNAMRLALGQPPSATGFEKAEPAMKQYLDGVLAQLKTAPADKTLLAQIVSASESVNRATLIAKVSDQNLQRKLTAFLPDIERAVKARPLTLALEAEIKELGGQLVCTPSAPQWLYLAIGDTGMDIFEVPTAIDLYNGNNPLKGKGGRNERVTDAWLKRLADVTTLRKLDLANCAVQGDGLLHLAKLTGLRELNLTLTPSKDDALKHLAGMTELRILGLASTQCTGTGFAHLKALRKLENVNFHFTPLNDAGLLAIAEVPISDRLWFAHTKFTDAGAASLAKQSQLKRLGMGSADKTSSGEAVAALTKLPLEDLALLDQQATAVGLAHAAKIATLRKLDASHAPTVGNDTLKLVAQMPALEEFKLGSAQVDDEGLQALAAAKSLKRLYLSGLKKVTPAGIERLKQARPGLVIEAK